MKDPAALLYIDTWLTSTAEMDSDVRGWYLNLILHHYDKKNLPTDIETLAQLAGVRFSEFERFKQMFKQVLEQKFEVLDGRYVNKTANEIIRKREAFTEKRSKSGNIGVVIKTAKTVKGFNAKYLDRLKSDLYDMNVEEIDKHKDKHLLEHLLKLYINGDGNGDILEDEIEGSKIWEGVFSNAFASEWNSWLKYRKTQKKELKGESIQRNFNSLVKLSGGNEKTAIAIIDQSISQGWTGLFELKNVTLTVPIEPTFDIYNKDICPGDDWQWVYAPEEKWEKKRPNRVNLNRAW